MEVVTLLTVVEVPLTGVDQVLPFQNDHFEPRVVPLGAVMFTVAVKLWPAVR